MAEFDLTISPDTSGTLRESDLGHDSDRRELERLRHRESLYGLAAALVEATTPAEVVRVTVRQATAAFAAAGTVVARSTADSKHIELLDAEGMPPDVAAEWLRFPISAPVPLSYVARTGQSLFLESAQDWERHFPTVAGLAAEVGHVANAVVPLLADGKPVGALGIAFTQPRCFDGEDRALAETIARQCAVALERARLLESERAARAAAVAASERVTKFLATMSHELRTPLQGIYGYTALLEQELEGPLSANQRSTLGRIRRNLQHVLSLVGEVLTLMRAEWGQAEYVLEDVSLSEALSFVDDATGPQRYAKQLSAEYVGQRDMVVRADPGKLRQILLNLVSNAIKFTPDCGRITIAIGREGEHVRIEVRDTGPGIPAAQLERVFEPFVRVGQGQSALIEGSGLGLAISREFARGMGGDLRASSAPGDGSTFILLVPQAAAV
jgi:signal transduction histidine kinase